MVFPSFVSHHLVDFYEKAKERREYKFKKANKKAGYNNLKECWTKSKEYKEKIKRIEETFPEELNFKVAFFGGKTNATKLRVKGKKLNYIDVFSLYPAVQFYCVYPVGHPIKILKLATYVRS
jgi:hypothetical protein